MVSARVIDRILRWAETQCGPVAETVTDELRRIEEAQRDRYQLQINADNETARHAAAVRLETVRHDAAMADIIDKGLALQCECRHWHTEGTLHTGFVCNLCGKKW